jgi:hypothetical protein
MKTIINCTLVLAVLLSFNVTSTFALKQSLKTEAAVPADISGTYSLILYGANYLDDLETIAILDYEGDEYHFAPFAPAYKYTVMKEMQGQEALKVAEEFVSFHSSFWKSQLSNILNEEGKTIGYELRPLYRPFNYGISNVLDVFYFPQVNGKVKTIIRLKNSIKISRNSGDGSSCSSGGN